MNKKQNQNCSYETSENVSQVIFGFGWVLSSFFVFNSPPWLIHLSYIHIYVYTIGIIIRIKKLSNLKRKNPWLERMLMNKKKLNNTENWKIPEKPKWKLTIIGGTKYLTQKQKQISLPRSETRKTLTHLYSISTDENERKKHNFWNFPS